MGTLIKTISLQVPVAVVYASMKDISSRYYTEDLRKGLTPPVHFTKDIPNSFVACETSGWGTRLEAEYTLCPTGEFACELTIKYTYRFALDASVRQSLIHEIGGFKRLEFGFNAGKKLPPPPQEQKS